MLTSGAASAWTIVTVTYNSGRDLERNWLPRDLDGAHWIVVDNASTDSSVDIATACGAEVVRCTRNHGFSKANNLGLERVTTPLVAFANPDVDLDAATLPVLASLLERHDALLGPQLRNRDGSAQAGARGLPFLIDKLAHRGITLPGARLGDYLLRTPAASGLVPAAWLMGAAVTARTNTMRRIGGWNEDYFLYYEDHELGLRAWRLGTPVLLCSEQSWIHDWARATTAPSISAWRNEIASAWTFYGTFPELLLPFRRLAWRRHAAWRAARNEALK